MNSLWFANDFVLILELLDELQKMINDLNKESLKIFFLNEQNLNKVIYSCNILRMTTRTEDIVLEEI